MYHEFTLDLIICPRPITFVGDAGQTSVQALYLLFPQPKTCPQLEVSWERVGYTTPTDGHVRHLCRHF